LIRPYQPRDRGAVRAISLSTAMMGEPASRFLDGDVVLADLLTRYFTDFEPESSFVAEANGQVVGYLIGTLDTARVDRTMLFRILWPAFFKAIFSGFFLKKKNWQVIRQFIPFVISGKFRTPDFDQQYPATLHINILDGYRSNAIGSRLMTTYLRFLSEKGIKGVRMATMSKPAGLFFAAHGFRLLFEGERPYFRHLIGKNVPLLIYGKTLN
jgi:hypothetical protein